MHTATCLNAGKQLGCVLHVQKNFHEYEKENVFFVYSNQTYGKTKLKYKIRLSIESSQYILKDTCLFICKVLCPILQAFLFLFYARRRFLRHHDFNLVPISDEKNYFLWMRWHMQ